MFLSVSREKFGEVFGRQFGICFEKGYFAIGFDKGYFGACFDRD